MFLLKILLRVVSVYDYSLRFSIAIHYVIFSLENACLQAINSLLILLFVCILANWISQIFFCFLVLLLASSSTSCLDKDKSWELHIIRLTNGGHYANFRLFIYYFWLVSECWAAFLLIWVLLWGFV